MRYIQLTNGEFVIVDNEDFKQLNQWKWRLSKDGYATRGKTIDGKQRTVSMHREITNCPKGLLVDHKNMYKLDNRKENLRICTHRQNSYNTLHVNRTGYKGVYGKRNSYQARIRIQGRTVSLGSRRTPEEAYELYKMAALQIHGEFARV